MAANASGARDVILQADQATIAAVAARHGATMKKWLETGAVLTVVTRRWRPSAPTRRWITSRATRSCAR